MPAWTAACALAMIVGAPGAAEPAAPPAYETVVLTLPRALELAGESAPATRAARARVGVARGRLDTAARPLRENPVLELEGASRSSPGGGSTDRGIALSQSFEPASRRSARRAAARAALEGAQGSAAEVRRRSRARVAAAFLRGLHASRRTEVARRSESLARRMAEVAQRRYEAGDIGLMEARLAALGLAPVRAEVALWRARSREALADLRRLLGIEPAVELELRGELEEALRDEVRRALEAMVRGARERADVQVLRARLEEAEAEVRLARSMARPEWQAWLGYEEEEGAEIVGGGVALSIPIFRRGKGEAAAARARAEALGHELAAVRNGAEVETRTAHRRLQLLEEAVGDLEGEAIESLDEDAARAERAYEAGALTLAELITYRRELTAAMGVHADLLLELALARTDLLEAAGEL